MQPPVRRLPPCSGAVTIYLLVILVPVLFAFLGFAYDLGRLYLIRGELKTAANAMALAAAQQLIGTESSLQAASAAAITAIAFANGAGNRYDFGSITIGEGNAMLASERPEPAFFDTLSAALEEGENNSSPADGLTARYVRVAFRADAPLFFFSFLSLGQERRTPIGARSVAGLSAPLCTACGIEPIAIPALDASDSVHFGYAPDTKYTLGFLCTGATPALLPGTVRRVNYLLLNRLNESAAAFADEMTQAFRSGNAGLPAVTSNPALSCFTMNAAEQIWATAAPLACTLNRIPDPVLGFVCGIAARFDTALQPACSNIPDASTLASSQGVDTDLNDLDAWSAYAGNLRRVITVPIVDLLNPNGTMTVLGFRQFLVEPNLGDISTNAADQNGRFRALYIGYPVPLKQGRFSACTVSAGPGKVVLHQ